MPLVLGYMKHKFSLHVPTSWLAFPPILPAGKMNYHASEFCGFFFFSGKYITYLQTPFHLVFPFFRRLHILQVAITLNFFFDTNFSSIAKQ